MKNDEEIIIEEKCDCTTCKLQSSISCPMFQIRIQHPDSNFGCPNYQIMKIDEFRNEHSFLSNFAEINIVINDKLWKTSEHMYMARKTNDPVLQEEIRLCETPAQAKKLGRSIKLREDWEYVKDIMMFICVGYKFTFNEEMGNKLLLTGNAKLIEGNHWHDNYWGDCNCDQCFNIVGQNRLGKILMQVREELLNFKE